MLHLSGMFVNGSYGSVSGCLPFSSFGSCPLEYRLSSWILNNTVVEVAFDIPVVSVLIVVDEVPYLLPCTPAPLPTSSFPSLKYNRLPSTNVELFVQ